MELHGQKCRWSLEARGDGLAAATGTECMAAPSGSRALQEQHAFLWGARGQPCCRVWRRVRKAQKLVVSWRGKKGKGDEDSALATAFCSRWPNLTIWQLSKCPARDLPAAQNTRCSRAVRSRAARYCLPSPAEPHGAGTSSFSLYRQGQANTR